MKFADFISTKSIRAELQALTKDEAIRELVKSLQDAEDAKREWLLIAGVSATICPNH